MTFAVNKWDGKRTTVPTGKTSYDKILNSNNNNRKNDSINNTISNNDNNNIDNNNDSNNQQMKTQTSPHSRRRAL